VTSVVMTSSCDLNVGSGQHRAFRDVAAVC
jgi:hypothetical protein